MREILPIRYCKHPSYTYTNVTINDTKLDTVFKPRNIETFFGTALYVHTDLPYVSRKNGESFEKAILSSYYFSATLEEDTNNNSKIEEVTCPGVAILFNYKGKKTYVIDGPKYSCAGESVLLYLSEGGKDRLEELRSTIMSDDPAVNKLTSGVDPNTYFLLAYDNVNEKYILECDKLEDVAFDHYKDRVGILYLGNDLLGSRRRDSRSNEVKVVARHWLRAINGEKGVLLLTALFDASEGYKLSHCYEFDGIPGVYYKDVENLCYEREQQKKSTVPYVIEHTINDAITESVKKLVRGQIENCAFAVKVCNICHYEVYLEYPKKMDCDDDSFNIEFDELDNVL